MFIDSSPELELRMASDAAVRWRCLADDAALRLSTVLHSAPLR
jgi:hypothetical protein